MSASDTPAEEIEPIVVNADLYTSEELEKMTITEIKALAKDKGYSITKSVKAEIIAEFLEKQSEAGE